MKTPQQIHDAKGYYKFFECIPEEKWCIGQFHNSEGQSCAIGHLVKSGDFTGESRCAFDALIGCNTTMLNDDPAGINRYLGPTPKQRILNKLKEIIDGN